MLSFIEFIDYYDLDIFLQEKYNIPLSNKKIIITYSFLNFFFKKKINNIEIYRNEKNYKKKFIELLNDANIFFFEMSFNDIYKLQENINFNKILQDCDNKTNRMINKIKWIVLEKNKLNYFLNYQKNIKKYKFIKEIQRLNIYDMLSYYNEYLNKEEIDNIMLTTISIL